MHANAPAKDREANRSRFDKFLKVGKEVSSPLDFSGLLGPMGRTAESIARAEACLVREEDRLRYGLLWFVQAHPLDTAAFGDMEVGDVRGAIEKWERKDTASTLQNRVVVALAMADYAGALGLAEVLYGQHAAELCQLLRLDGRYGEEALRKALANVLLEDVGGKALMAAPLSAPWRDEFGAGVVEPLLAELRAMVATASRARERGSREALHAGRKLAKEAPPKLEELKAILGKRDARYEAIADKLGQEVLQCSIDYFNEAEGEGRADNALQLLRSAKGMVVGRMARDRVRENEAILEKMKKQEAVRVEMDTFMASVVALGACYSLIGFTAALERAILAFLKMKRVLGKSEVAEYGTVLQRVVLNGIIDFFNNDIYSPVNDVQVLCSAIPLTHKSFVISVLDFFDDWERGSDLFTHWIIQTELIREAASVGTRRYTRTVFKTPSTSRPKEKLSSTSSKPTPSKPTPSKPTPSKPSKPQARKSESPVSKPVSTQKKDSESGERSGIIAIVVILALIILLRFSQCS
ncbi:MAG: hypothetical protein CSA07_03575 [Bacteroidia bacterium]|nr:MAG: hypothetical protein CSA07_03575 [Bacteroidia bacterium]